MVNREKAFFITVESGDRQMATDMANGYAANLDRLNRLLNVTSATRNRMFIERRLEEKGLQLAKAEEDRKQFQIANRTLLVTDKAQAAMRAAGSIEENIIDLEVQLAGLKEFATPSHPMMNQVDVQIQALRKQLDRLEQRQEARIGASSPRGESRESTAKAFYTPMLEVPGLALEYIRLTREVRIHEAMLGMLTNQYEQARIAEARDTPTIQILDPAIPAEHRSRPRTLHNMQVAALVTIFAGVFLVLFLDYLKRLRVQETYRMREAALAAPDAAVPDPSELQIASGGNGGETESRPHGTTLPAAYRERQSKPTTF
jgi:uncharacterized protein involved in exopolysaccharide biosynthesis